MMIRSGMQLSFKLVIDFPTLRAATRPCTFAKDPAIGHFFEQGWRQEKIVDLVGIVAQAKGADSPITVARIEFKVRERRMI